MHMVLSENRCHPRIKSEGKLFWTTHFAVRMVLAENRGPLFGTMR